MVIVNWRIGGEWGPESHIKCTLDLAWKIGNHGLVRCTDPLEKTEMEGIDN
jgi:hypothetical protein